MARPTLATQVNDFLGSLSSTTSFDLTEKSILRKLFSRAVGKSLTADVSATTTTPADVAGLTFNIRKGDTYRIFGRFPVTAPGAGGVKLLLNATGQTTPGLVVTTVATAAAAAVATQATAFGTIIASTTAALMVEIDGGFKADGNGVLQLQFAQNAASGTTVLGKGGWLQVLKVG